MRFTEHFSPITAQSRVDRENNVIRDVLVLGPQSANGRTYTADALAAAVKLYEGVPVYLDHQPEGRRSYRDKIGRLTNAKFVEGKIRADLHVNPAHPATSQLLWDAENNPAAVGLSHDAEGRVTTRNGVSIVESIERVNSADLVAEPATTKSLFEDKNVADTPAPNNGNGNGTPADPLAALYASLTLEDLTAKRPDLLDALKKQIQQEIATPMGDLKSQLQALQAKLDEYTAAEAADQQMAESKLDPTKVPPRLRESIRKERNPQRRAQLIEDVQKLVAQQQPTSSSGFYGSTTPTGEADLKARIESWRI